METNLIQDLDTFLLGDKSQAQNRYNLVRHVLKVQFHLPEIDFVRNEIGKCYVIGAYQACITLTNHLLERYCKLVLIAKNSDNFSFTDLETIEDRFAPTMKEYMSQNLSFTLNACKSQGIIDKALYKNLDFYRKVFRNGFGHAEAKKILRGAKGKFAIGHISGPSKLEMKELTFEKIPFLHGIAIEMMAKENAWPYFVVVENFIRSTIRHYIKDQFDFNIEMV